MPVASLPHGDQRKLEVALLMALEPQVYMFDEPTAGMSHDEAPVILNLIRELKKDKRKTILLVEHKMDVVRELADRIIVLTNGTLVADGEPAEVIASPVVQRPTWAWVRMRGRSMSDNLLTLEGVHTHIGAYHILHGVDLPCRAASSPCCWAATARARPPRCAPSWACGRPARAASASAGRTSRRATPQIASRHRLCAREHGHLRRPHGQGEPAAGRARRAQRRRWTRAPGLDLRLFPAVRSSGTTRPASSAAGKSRCWPWRAPSSSRASC
jgi:hypothetical protein